jgi:sulfate permease, SulP family
LIAEAKPRVVLLDLSAVFDLEYSALKMLIDAEKRQRAAGVSLWLAGIPPDVYIVVQRSALGETLGPERLAHNLEIAVDRYLTSSKKPEDAP